ncbi:molecular chaperone DnaJ [Phytophthora cinnamomi]|uniref:molecular chaperone DnaJ n=1 Tax=Phytophthora cinnamomi TaxID=4785 RepID=UPI00355A4002|nr:molecular chaperone DnaJ [Phytophthora cinnamomi]
MLPRRALRRAALTPIGPPRVRNYSVVHSDAKRGEESGDRSGVSTHSALQRQQLEFCCLLCGWDVACSTCPFNWFNFDPRKFRARQRRRPGDDDPRHLAASEADVRQALGILGIDAAPVDKVSLSQQQVKDAFRAKALEWHPDCNQDPEAEAVFKQILQAYELLLAHAR